MGWTLPITHYVGDSIVVSDFNTYVRDNTNFLYGDTAWTPVSAFTNGWSAAAPGAYYRKMGTLVLLRGALTGGTGDASAFTLPSGYLPAVNQEMCVVGALGAATFLALGSAGTVAPHAACYIDGVTFSTV